MKIEPACASVSEKPDLGEDFWKNSLTMVAENIAFMIDTTMFKELQFLEKLTLEVDSYMPGGLFHYIYILGK